MPLSAPPMREPRPPASTSAVTSDSEWARGVAFTSDPMRSAADVRHLDARRVLTRLCRLAAAQLRIAVAARFPDARDGGPDVLVARAAADEGAQVVTRDREQTQIELA